MLLGNLKYTDETGSICLNVICRPSVSDIRLYLAPEDVHDMDRVYDFYDRDWNESAGRTRRIDISLSANKVKTNLTNKDFAVKVAAAVKYLVVMSKGTESFSILDTGEFSSVYSKQLDGVGKVTFNYGVVQSLSLKTPFVQMELGYQRDYETQSGTAEIIREDLGSIFSQLKRKDKYGHVLSETPIKDWGYAFCTEFLGSAYVPPKIKSGVKSAYSMGLYESIEAVIEAHPDKNYAWILDRKYYIVSDETLESVIADFMTYDGVIAFDTETSGLGITFKSITGDDDQLVGVVLSKEVGTGYYFPLQHKAIKNLCNNDHWFFMEKYMKPLLETKQIVTHNANFDWKVAYIYGINTNIVFDTMIAYSVTKKYEDKFFRVGLKQLEKLIFNVDAFELSDFVEGSWGDSEVRFWDLPYEFVRRYAPTDADFTLALYEFIKKTRLIEEYNASRVFKIEVNFAKVIAYSEFYGYHLDVEDIPKLRKDIDAGLDKTYAKLKEIVGHDFNPSSPQQVAKILYDDMKIEPYEGKRSTDKDVLKFLSNQTDANGDTLYPIAKVLKEYRDYSAIKKSFLNRLDKDYCLQKKVSVVATPDGFIFPEVNSFGATTGRVSIKEPNYQSYNDVMKKYITPRPDFGMWDSDFSQVEYRTLVSLAQQTNLMKEFEDPDMDYHTYQASRMFGVPYACVTKALRSQSKGINFGLPFGMGDYSLGKRIYGKGSKENMHKATVLRRKYFQGQERIQDFFQRVRDEGVRAGYTSTRFGRRRYYHKGQFDEAAIRRQAGNHVIQGTAADIYKIAVVSFFLAIVEKGWLGKVLFIAFIHDELLTEMHKSINPYEYLEVWRNAYEVKLKGFCRFYAGCGFGTCWYDAKKHDLPPQYLDETITDANKEKPWNENLEEFERNLYDGLSKHERKRIVDYMKDEKNQGEIATPKFSSLLHDTLVEDISAFDAGKDSEDYIKLKRVYGIEDDKLVEKKAQRMLQLRDEFGYNKKGKDKGKNFSNLRKNIEMYCEFIGMDASAVNILDASESVERGTESTSAENVQVNLDELDFTEMVNMEIDTLGYYLDTDRDCIYLNYSEQEKSALLTILNTCCNMESGYQLVIRYKENGERKFKYMDRFVNLNAVSTVQQLIMAVKVD